MEGLDRQNSEMFDNAAANPDDEDVDILEEVQNKTIAEVIDEEQLEANNNDIEHEVPVGEKEEQDDLDRAD
jgi:hypothetical protein